MKMTVRELKKIVAAIPKEDDSREVVHLDHENGYSIPSIYQRKCDNGRGNMWVLGMGLSRAED